MPPESSAGPPILLARLWLCPELDRDAPALSPIAIVNRPFLIGSIQFRFPVPRLVDSGLPLIRHDQSRSAAEEIQRAGVGTDPIRQTASPRGFGVGVAAGFTGGNVRAGQP